MKPVGFILVAVGVVAVVEAMRGLQDLGAKSIPAVAASPPASGAGVAPPTVSVPRGGDSSLPNGVNASGFTMAQNANANGIVSWAYQNAGRLGTDACRLATALLTSSQYEASLSDVYESNPQANPGGVQGCGPFQITPCSKGSEAGYNPHTAQGSLDYFMAVGDMQTGVAALNSGTTSGRPREDCYDALNSALARLPRGAAVAHAWETFAGKPNQCVDVTRIQNGDWLAAYQNTQVFLPGDCRGR